MCVLPGRADVLCSVGRACEVAHKIIQQIISRYTLLLTKQARLVRCRILESYETAIPNRHKNVTMYYCTQLQIVSSSLEFMYEEARSLEDNYSAGRMH